MTDRQEPGPIADEAARLVEAALDWVRQAAPNTGQPGEECAGCPFCRALRAIRRDRPELAERLTGAVVDLAGAAAAVMRVLSEPGDATGADATDPRERDSGPESWPPQRDSEPRQDSDRAAPGHEPGDGGQAGDRTTGASIRDEASTDVGSRPDGRGAFRRPDAERINVT